jgi:predicted cupin superfamily sugar epimerase
MDPYKLIQTLDLKPHPEGGFYKETYRGSSEIEVEKQKMRNTATAIYYLLLDEDKSHFHKVLSDEIWLYHQGKTVEIYEIDNSGNLIIHYLGIDIQNGEKPQIVIPKNHWFAAKIKNNAGFCLVSCIVAPGFEFEDFVLANQEDLLKQYPQYQEIIEQMCL